MIISRTPYRVSFFGGGTDYPIWYRRHGGQVLATSINQYLYISCRYLPPFFSHKLRLSYSIIEECVSVDEIRHPSAREVLQYLGIRDGVEIHYDGDLPSKSGVGSSSAFTVGLLNVIHAYKGEMISADRLAKEAIHIEQEILGEVVGSQDQVSTAHGGLNNITFSQSGEIVVTPVILKEERKRTLEKNLMLVFTGISRTASEIASTYVSALNEQQCIQAQLSGLVDEGIELLISNNNLDEFGQLLDRGWQQKQKLSTSVSSSDTEEIYQRARSAGALGGKILGAGGGGMMLFYVPEHKQDNVKGVLSELTIVPFLFEANGSQIIYYSSS